MRLWVFNVQQRGTGYIEKQFVSTDVWPTADWLCSQCDIHRTDAEAIIRCLGKLLEVEQPHTAIVTEKAYSVQGFMI